MVEYSDDLTAVFQALAAPARRRILRALQEGPKTVGELAAPLDMSFAGASKHVGVLESARLLERRKQGRSRVCTLRPEGLARADEWIRGYTRFWNERLDLLERTIDGGGGNG